MRNYFNYFTEIEERFQQRRGSLLMLSTLDWVLIETWREAGFPLEVVLRGIDTAFDHFETRQQRAQARGKGRLRRVNGLAWCAQAVLESAEQAARASLADPDGSPAPASSTETGFEQDRVARFLRANADRLTVPGLPEPAAAILAETAVRLRALADDRDPASPPARTATTAHAAATTTETINNNLLPHRPSLEELDRTLSSLEERLVAALIAATPEAALHALREQAALELAPYRGRMGAVQIRQVQQQFLHKRLLEQHRIPRLSLFYMGMA